MSYVYTLLEWCSEMYFTLQWVSGQSMLFAFFKMKNNSTVACGENSEICYLIIEHKINWPRWIICFSISFIHDRFDNWFATCTDSRICIRYLHYEQKGIIAVLENNKCWHKSESNCLWQWFMFDTWCGVLGV